MGLIGNEDICLIFWNKINETFDNCKKKYHEADFEYYFVWEKEDYKRDFRGRKKGTSGSCLKSIKFYVCWVSNDYIWTEVQYQYDLYTSEGFEGYLENWLIIY